MSKFFVYEPITLHKNQNGSQYLSVQGREYHIEFARQAAVSYIKETYPQGVSGLDIVVSGIFKIGTMTWSYKVTFPSTSEYSTEGVEILDQ